MDGVSKALKRSTSPSSLVVTTTHSNHDKKKNHIRLNNTRSNSSQTQKAENYKSHIRIRSLHLYRPPKNRRSNSSKENMEVPFPTSSQTHYTDILKTQRNRKLLSRSQYR